jgi:hypothetical protein
LRYDAAKHTPPSTGGTGGQEGPTDIPNLPDIQVAWLSRAPVYAPYQVDYADGWTPTLRPGTENAKHWPDAGEPITYTARVANRGTQPTGVFGFRWQMDGVTVAVGSVDNLLPGQWIALTMHWRWDQARHWVSFDADPAGLVSEASELNNGLREATDALYQDIRVHPYVYEAFTHYQNARGSYNFEDWVQTQYAQMNERFTQAVYPETPQGILDRVRINAIRVVTDMNTSLPDHDGSWQFDVEADDPDTPQNESRESAERYAQAFATGIDWGLIHELMHQLGFIDLYQVDVEADRVLLSGKDGLPLLSSYTCRNCDLMSGGDTTPYRNPTYLSRYTAAAMNRNYGFRRGYYGEFLYDIPLTNVLVLRDNAGSPLVGALVEVFQSFENSLPETPVISGVSDANGAFVLSNRPVSTTVTTATGHTLRSNPFGRINVVGTNGVLLLRVSRGEHEDYIWKQILDFNLAFWNGLTQTYPITWETHLPPLDAPPPPPTMTGRVELGTAALSWRGLPQATSYRVYVSEDPFDEWRLQAITPATTLSVALSRTTRFAVTAVDGSGRESGFSAIVRAFRWVYPSDVVYERGPGNWLVLDGHGGALVQMLGDGRVVGNRVSPHWTFVGGQALSYGPGQALAIVQGEQATVLNTQLHRIGFVGRSDREPLRLEQATGILLAGEAFSTTVRPDDDAATLLLGHFDGDWQASGAQPLAVSATFTSGVSGQAAFFDEGARLIYAGAGHFVETEGGLDFWVRPEWDGSESGTHTFFSAGDGQSYRFEVGVQGGWLYAWITKFDNYNQVALWRSIGDWQSGEWHHIGVSWQPHWLKLYVDGEMADVTGLRRPITGTLGVLSIGADADGRNAAQAAIDELRVSGIARVGNSDAVRLLVSEENNARLKILDLMGNVLATWSDARLARPRGLAMRPNGLIAVADTSDGAIELLSYDGRETLAYHSTFVSGLDRPQNIASDGERLLVPDYGHGLVRVYGADGRVLASYSAPNDGYSGAFGGPAAVARGVWGDLLVTDKSKQRVTFIWGGIPGLRQFLPVIVR